MKWFLPAVASEKVSKREIEERRIVRAVRRLAFARVLRINVERVKV